MRLFALLSPLFLALSGPALVAQALQAQTIDRLYGSIRGWAVTAHFEGSRHVACTASIDDAGQSMALSRDAGRFWSGRVPAGALTTSGPGWIEIDGTGYRSMLTISGPDVMFPLSDEIVDAIRAGDRLVVRGADDALSPAVVLRGTAAATARIDECFNLGGVSPSTPIVAPQAAAPQNPATEPADDEAVGANCPAPGSAGSAPGGDVIKVTFVNQSARVLTLFWLASDATPHEMVRLNPGSQARLDASTGHLWQVRAPDGACIGGLISTPPTGGFVYLR